MHTGTFKKFTALSLMVTLLLAVFAGCGGASEISATETGKLSVTDMTGRVIELEDAPDRIVVLDAASCEIVYALGAEASIVGRGEYCDYPEAALELPAVASGDQTNIEQVLALGPQLILTDSMGHYSDQIEAFEKAGVPVAQSAATSIEQVYEAIDMIGKLTGRDKEADEQSKIMKFRFESVREKAAKQSGGEKKSVYFEVSPLEWGLWTAGSDTFMDEIANMLGLENAFADITGWGEISQEQVILRNPDYIISVAMYFGEGVRPEEEIKSRAGWQDVKAVAEGNVYLASTNEISRPGPRLADAAEMLYDMIYEQQSHERLINEA